jgi:hypothetical protein
VSYLLPVEASCIFTVSSPLEVAMILCERQKYVLVVVELSSTILLPMNDDIYKPQKKRLKLISTQFKEIVYLREKACIKVVTATYAFVSST